MMEISQKINITGIIMPHDWDESGRIIEIALYTDTEEVYALEHNSLTGELMNLLHRSVEIKGNMRKHPAGNRSISAHNYIVLEETVENE